MPLGVIRIVLNKVEDEDVGDAEYWNRIVNGAITGGILKSIAVTTTGTSSLVATVPAGKDWYLQGWKVATQAITTKISFEYPTGTVLEIMRTEVNDSGTYEGIMKGFKITAGQTVTLKSGSALIKEFNMFILEVPVGTSPEIL